MNRAFHHILKSRVIETAARWFIGLIFIYAGYYKIIAPAEFAKMIYGYGLFPGELINLIAIVLPFIELFTGLMLIVGVWTRSAMLIINILLILFILLISINLIRGHQFDCGCFSAAADLFSAETPWKTLIRDLILISMGWYVYRYKGKPEQSTPHI